MVLSKNIIGIVTSLLLVIILSQAKFFDFLFDSSLGRSILILFIIIISWSNKFLGIFIVLLLALLFNQNTMEGFTDPSGNTIQPPDKKKEKVNNMVNSTNANTNDDNTNADENNNTNVAAEGFDIIGMETNIKRGKPSKTIATNDSLRIPGSNTEPFNGLYSESYAQF